MVEAVTGGLGAVQVHRLGLPSFRFPNVTRGPLEEGLEREMGGERMGMLTMVLKTAPRMLTTLLTRRTAAPL